MGGEREREGEGGKRAKRWGEGQRGRRAANAASQISFQVAPFQPTLPSKRVTSHPNQFLIPLHQCFCVCDHLGTEFNDLLLLVSLAIHLFLFAQSFQICLDLPQQTTLCLITRFAGGFNCPLWHDYDRGCKQADNLLSLLTLFTSSSRSIPLKSTTLASLTLSLVELT